MTLIDRLSKLEGPCGHYTAMDMAIHSPFKDKERELFIEALNGSVVAAIALAERVFPGKQGLYLTTEWTGIKHPGNGVSHSVQLRKSLHGYIFADGKGANLAIALCIALLRAKEASKP